MRRVVWDWNGTLFDDLHVILDAVNLGLEPLGLGPIDLDDYRTHYTRPVKLFYDRLAGRDMTEVEWHAIDRRFHDGYRELMRQARPTHDAIPALDLVRTAGIPQSLLSMFPHPDLVPLVSHLGLAGYFDRIDGLRGAPGDTKAAYLEQHLSALIGDTAPVDVLVIGDTPDDAVAAGHVGAGCVLYNNGSHHREELESVGVPVVDSLVAAVQPWIR
jgi:phosphoglycolate phosphatase-like HAD superfamily hydrolase